MQQKKKSKPIYHSKNSKSMFLLPIFIFIISCLMFVTTKSLSFFTALFMFSFICLIPAYLSFSFRKYIISQNKIYIFEKNKKILSWTFSDDFLCIDYKQSFLGKLLNYGDLYISNRDNKFYLYKNIQNPKEAYIKTIIQYEKIALLLDPNYIPSYNSKGEKNSLDKKINNNNNNV